MGIGVRGPGEKQLEVDRRLVEKRIQDLSEDGQIQARKERQVAARRRLTVSLVGYTNAGKSTLLNVLTGADVLTENKLFATLDTRTRRWRFPAGAGVALRHSRLHPQSAAQLGCLVQGDARRGPAGRLLLHVVDVSSPEAESQILWGGLAASWPTSGSRDHPTLLVLNKSDKVPDRSYLDVLKAHHAESVAISAAQRRRARST